MDNNNLIDQNNYHDYVVMSQTYYITNKNDLAFLQSVPL